MGDVITIGLDIAKSVFQIHGVDADGTVVIRKRVSRAKVLEFFAAECCSNVRKFLPGRRPHVTRNGHLQQRRRRHRGSSVSPRGRPS